MPIEEGDIVLCTVERIVGTVVFVTIGDTGKEGNIIFSEIAPGRIRNIRDYVVPKKKIVCKVLRVRGNNIDLSLRRVTQKETKEILEKDKQEKSYTNILRGILKEESDKAIKEITPGGGVYEFLEKAKENPKSLEQIVGKNNAEKILEIIKTQKQKKAILKKEIFMTTSKPNGLNLVKQILKGFEKEAEIKYIAAGKFSIKVESPNIKSADNKLREIISGMEKQTKKEGVEFGIKEK